MYDPKTHQLDSNSNSNSNSKKFDFSFQFSLFVRPRGEERQGTVSGGGLDRRRRFRMGVEVALRDAQHAVPCAGHHDDSDAEDVQPSGTLSA